MPRQIPQRIAVLAAVAACFFVLGVSWERHCTPPGSEQARQLLQNSEKLRGDQLQAQPTVRIPKTLHHIFISKEGGAMEMWPEHERWVRNCRHHYESAGWEYRLWDADACEELVAQHYPQFLDFYRHNVSLANEKSDLMRYIVLHRYGGLYLDSDVDCWREGGDMLEGADVVLQGSHNGEGAGSASIASVPGAPIWMAALELVQRRGKSSSPSWWQSIYRTGPDLLTDAAEHVGVKRGKDKLFSTADYQIGGLVYRVYPGGSWFLPCQWWEGSCRRRTYQALAIGQQDLTRTVGMHRFAGSWIEGRERGKGIMNVTDELCNPTPDLY